MSSNHPGGYHLSDHRLVTLEQSSTYFTEVSSFMTSKLVSSFELLAQPIIPSAFAPAGIENPFVVQAYFLIISNFTQNEQVTPAPPITLRFVLDGINPPAIPLTFTDKTTAKSIPLVVGTPSFVLEAKLDPANSVKGTDTTTFLLQPDVKKILQQGGAPNYELRGYVTIDAPAGTQLLLSPQTRGTFFRGTLPNLTVVSEESSVLPTAQGPLYVF